MEQQTKQNKTKIKTNSVYKSFGRQVTWLSMQSTNRFRNGSSIKTFNEKFCNGSSNENNDYDDLCVRSNT
uniref:Uncharacterized protein n=1 Tax=Glossina brevipalpis TaxID=37001 RepID=A0A1A9WUG6_9MUSC